jgi:uncharacterized HAD superfamily protein
MRIGLDLDGVLCATPFGRFATRPVTAVTDLPEGYEALYDVPSPPNPLRGTVEYARFGWRRLAPGAAEALRELSQRHELYVVTGRSRAGEALLRRWLARNHVDAAITSLRMAPPGLRPPQHKLAVARMLEVGAHIDDDPRTAYHLARNGVPRVFLLDAAGRHDHPNPPDNLTIVRSLREFVEALRD